MQGIISSWLTLWMWYSNRLRTFLWPLLSPRGRSSLHVARSPGAGSRASAAAGTCRHTGAAEGEAGDRHGRRSGERGTRRGGGAREEDGPSGRGTAEATAAGFPTKPAGHGVTGEPSPPADEQHQHPRWVHQRFHPKYLQWLTKCVIDTCILFSEDKQDLSLSISSNGSASITVSVEVNGVIYSGVYYCIYTRVGLSNIVKGT